MALIASAQTIQAIESNLRETFFSLGADDSLDLAENTDACDELIREAARAVAEIWYGVE